MEQYQLDAYGGSVPNRLGHTRYKLTPLNLSDFFIPEIKVWPRPPKPAPDVMITPDAPAKRLTWRDKLKALWPWK